MPRAAIVALLLLCACGDAGMAPDGAAPDAAGPAFAAVPNPSFEPFAFTVSNCVEPVDVSGSFHAIIRGLPGTDPHALFHINAKGTGIGRVTGARYQWNDRLFDHTNVAVSGAGSFILNDDSRLIGQGRAPNAKLHVRTKVTVNANGVFTVDETVVTESCN